LVALQTAGSLTTLVLLLFAEGFRRPAYMTLPLALAFLNVVGTLVFARFLGRHV
jgi:multisubunit Na+/H+ antiporter MnhF subunit